MGPCIEIETLTDLFEKQVRRKKSNQSVYFFEATKQKHQTLMTYMIEKYVDVYDKQETYTRCFVIYLLSPFVHTNVED